MTAIEIFGFQDYRAYLLSMAGNSDRRSGLRLRLAKIAGCQPAYLSQILKGSANLSLEQAFRIARFLNHGPDEREMFLLLVQRERAGDADLRAHFDAQIQGVLDRRHLIKNRLKNQESLGADDQAIYYGRWLCGCLHIIVTIPGLQTREAIANYLSLPIDDVGETLDFLESCGLILRDDGGSYRIGPRHIHLPDSSPNIRKHHANWRLKALQSLDRPTRKNEAHYSVLVTLSRTDAALIRERILRLIDETMQSVTASPEEVLFCQVIDWFEIP